MAPRVTIDDDGYVAIDGPWSLDTHECPDVYAPNGMSAEEVLRVIREDGRISIPDDLRPHVITWTEPTDDDPNRYPIVMHQDCPVGWEATWGFRGDWTANPARITGWTWAAVRPPPAPKTERVDWWECRGRKVEHEHEWREIRAVSDHGLGVRLVITTPDDEDIWLRDCVAADGTVVVLAEDGDR